jgi:hypothetical protein
MIGTCGLSQLAIGAIQSQAKKNMASEQISGTSTSRYLGGGGAVRSGILLMMQSSLSLYIIQTGGELESSFGPSSGLGSYTNVVE